MRVLETDHWSLLLPPEWFAEQDEESVLISDGDGVGCLELSMLFSDGAAFDENQVREICEDPIALQPAELSDCPGWTRRFVEDDAALREWFVIADASLLYITYSCDLDNAGMDDAAVDDILSTLRMALE